MIKYYIMLTVLMNRNNSKLKECLYHNSTAMLARYHAGQLIYVRKIPSSPPLLLSPTF